MKKQMKIIRLLLAICLVLVIPALVEATSLTGRWLGSNGLQLDGRPYQESRNPCGSGFTYFHQQRGNALVSDGIGGGSMPGTRNTHIYKDPWPTPDPYYKIMFYFGGANPHHRDWAFGLNQ